MHSMLKSMPGKDTGVTDSVPDTASKGDISESSDILPSAMSSPDIPPSPAHTRSHGKAKKKVNKDRGPFYGVVYLPGDIKGLTKKFIY